MPTGIQVSESTLWELLKGCELFASLTEKESESFLDQYRQGRGMRVRNFQKNEMVCHKGQFELDLCVILKGAVDFRDDVPGQGHVSVATRSAPDFYGEAGAMGGLPRSTDGVAAEDNTQIFYLPGSALGLVVGNPEAERILNKRYKERTLGILTEQLDIFKGVSKEFVDSLIPRCEIVNYDTSGVTIIGQGEPGDSMYIIRDGWVQISRRDANGDRILAYLGPNEYIGEMAIFAADRRRDATAISAGRCELVKIPYSNLNELLRRYPQVEISVRDTIARRHEAETKLTPPLEQRLREWGQLNLIQNEALLVMDLDLCVKCDNCVKACETLHGESRLVRTGMQLDNYLVPSACYHCDDPKCMSSCPTGAIKRRPEGEIYFEYDICIGCGNCAIACPYDNIAMIESHKFDRAQAQKERALSRDFFRPYPVTRNAEVERSPLAWLLARKQGAAPQIAAAPAAGSPVGHVPPNYPIKCDLCDGLPFMGCVHNCPTGAAIRIEPATLFKMTGAVTVNKPRVMIATEAPQRKFPKAIPLALLCSFLVVGLGTLSAGLARSWSAYWTGGCALAGFALAASYSLRKRSLLFSVRWLDWIGLKSHSRGGAATLQSRIRWLDNLKTWRSAHVLLGVGTLLPLWWHIGSAPLPPNPMEWLLLAAIAVLVASGVLGTVIQDFFPHTADKQSEHRVRLKDVEVELRTLLKAATDGAVGHGEEFERAYHEEIEPILYNAQPFWRLVLATLRSSDPAQKACARARKSLETFRSMGQNDAFVAAYAALCQLAERKVRLEQNRANLRFTTGWLRYHISVAIVTGVLLIFHIIGAFLFAD